MEILGWSYRLDVEEYLIDFLGYYGIYFSINFLNILNIWLI